MQNWAVLGTCSCPARHMLVTCSVWFTCLVYMSQYCGNYFFCFAVYFSFQKRIENTPIQQSHQSQLENRSHIWIGGILVDTLIMYFSSPCFMKKKKHQSEIKKRSLTVYMDWRHPGWYIYYVILSSPCFITKIAFQSFRVTILKKVIIQLFAYNVFF